MEEDRFFRAQPFYHRFDNVTRADQARPGMTHHAAALETLRVQPASHEGKVLAAVVVLAVVDAGDLLALANEDDLGRR